MNVSGAVLQMKIPCLWRTGSDPNELRDKNAAYHLIGREASRINYRLSVVTDEEALLDVRPELFEQVGSAVAADLNAKSLSVRRKGPGVDVINVRSACADRAAQDF